MQTMMVNVLFIMMIGCLTSAKMGWIITEQYASLSTESVARTLAELLDYLISSMLYNAAAAADDDNIMFRVVCVTTA